MLIIRETTITRENLINKNYKALKSTDREVKTLTNEDKDEFYNPAVRLLGEIYEIISNEGGYK